MGRLGPLLNTHLAFAQPPAEGRRGFDRGDRTGAAWLSAAHRERVEALRGARGG
jgi:hypothetical protein